MVVRKLVVLSEVAALDVQAAIDHYIEHAGADVADAFVEALTHAWRHIEMHPGTGSPRYSLKLDVPGLRSWPAGRFPYLVFYFELPSSISVERVLHGAMDISQVFRAHEPDAEYAVDTAPEWDLS